MPICHFSSDMDAPGKISYFIIICLHVSREPIYLTLSANGYMQNDGSHRVFSAKHARCRWANGLLAVKVRNILMTSFVLRMDGKLHKGCSRYVWVKSCCSLLPMPSTFSLVDIQKVADWVKRLRFGSLNALSTPPANALAQSRKLIDCPFISVQRCRAADRSC